MIRARIRSGTSVRSSGTSVRSGGTSVRSIVSVCRVIGRGRAIGRAIKAVPACITSVVVMELKIHDFDAVGRAHQNPSDFKGLQVLRH